MTIEITYKPRLKDSIDAYNLNRKKYRSTIDRVIDGCVLILAIAFLAYFRSDGGYTTYLMITAGIIALFSLLNICIFCYLIIAFQFKIIKTFKNTHTLLLTEKDIHYTTTGIESQFDWSLFYDMLENNNLFLLVYDKHQYIVIPKAHLTEITIKKFRELVTKKIKINTVPTA